MKCVNCEKEAEYIYYGMSICKKHFKDIQKNDNRWYKWSKKYNFQLPKFRGDIR